MANSKTSTTPQFIMLVLLGLAILFEPALAAPLYVHAEAVLWLKATATPASPLEINVGERQEAFATTRPRPRLRTAGSWSRGASEHLARAHVLAVDRLRVQPACRALFRSLGDDGERLLALSMYVPAQVHHETQICGRKVVAFTKIGSPVTRLCRGFRRLNAEDGALILLHEALHFAGLREAPRDPEVPTSEKINEMVAVACDL